MEKKQFGRTKGSRKSLEELTSTQDQKWGGCPPCPAPLYYFWIKTGHPGDCPSYHPEVGWMRMGDLAAWHKRRGARGTSPEGNRWRAQILHKGKKEHIGSYASEEEAHEAYLKRLSLL